MMQKKKMFAVILIILAFILAACNRAGSEATPDPNAGDGSGLTNNQQLQTAQAQAATQTAQAPQIDGIGGGASPDDEATAEAAGPTNTPPPTNTPVPTQTPVPTVPTEYTLRAGEFPFCIARRFNINPTDLLNANNLANGNFFEPGLVLTIPQGGGVFPGERSLAPHPATYTVVAGDTFTSIACKYGDVYPGAIASANGMTITDELVPGATLQIP